MDNLAHCRAVIAIIVAENIKFYKTYIIYNPQQNRVRGYTVFMLSVFWSVHLSIHPYYWVFPYILETLRWKFIKHCMHIDIDKMYICFCTHYDLYANWSILFFTQTVCKIYQQLTSKALKEQAIFKTILEQLLLYHLQTLCKTVYMYLFEGLMED